MGDRIEILFKSYKIYGKMDLLWLFRDTKYCILQIFADLVGALAAVVLVFSLSKQFDEIGGFNGSEMALMLGISMHVHGLYNLFFSNYNNGMVSRIIGRGQIEHYIIQPVPIIVQIITRGFAPFSGSSQMLLSWCLIIHVLLEMKCLTIFIIFKLFVFSFISLVIMVSFIYLISSLAFYYPVAAEDVAQMGVGLFTETSNFPLGNLSIKWQLFFSSVLPLGVIAWIPTNILVKHDFSDMALFIVVGVGISLFSSFIFKKGLSYYGKKGGGRYSGFGHR